jgi:hypothetical protein
MIELMNLMFELLCEVLKFDNLALQINDSMTVLVKRASFVSLVFIYLLKLNQILAVETSQLVDLISFELQVILNNLYLFDTIKDLNLEFLTPYASSLCKDILMLTACHLVSLPEDKLLS